MILYRVKLTRLLPDGTCRPLAHELLVAAPDVLRAIEQAKNQEARASRTPARELMPVSARIVREDEI